MGKDTEGRKRWGQPQQAESRARGRKEEKSFLEYSFADFPVHSFPGLQNSPPIKEGGFFLSPAFTTPEMPRLSPSREKS